MCKKTMRKTKRMDKPNDTLVKRQASYAGDVMHEFHNFSGTYAGPCMNEYPNVGGGVPRTDSTYYVFYNGKKCVMNWEDESTPIDIETLKKIDNYRVNLEYTFKKPVISGLTTEVPIEKCERIYKKSPTLTLKPIIRLYPECDGRQRLINIKTKIINQEILSKVEAMDLIMIPKMFTSNHAQVLEEVCHLLSQLKIKDFEFKLELIFEMQCVIHKFAKTIADIERLEEVIGLKEAVTAMQFQNQKLIDLGAFEMAIKVKNALGIEKAIEISGFSREELESEKLNR